MVNTSSAVELCADELVVGGGVGWSYDRLRIFHRRRRRRGIMVGGGGVGGVRPDERALKQPTRWTGVFLVSKKGQPLHLCQAAGAEKLTVNMHAVHNFTVVMSFWRLI